MIADKESVFVVVVKHQEDIVMENWMIHNAIQRTFGEDQGIANVLRVIQVL